MEGSSSIAVSGEALPADWRTGLKPEMRVKIVNRIMDILLRRWPLAVPQGLHELKKVALLLEDKIYTTAASQSDYLREITLRMLSVRTVALVPGIDHPMLNPAFEN